AAIAGLFLSLVGGHPESAFHVAGVSGLWFLRELARARRRGRAFGAAIGAGVIAFALAAPALLPVLEVIPQTREARDRAAPGPHRTSNSFAEAGKSAVGAVFPDFYGRWLSPSSPSAPSFLSATVASAGGIALALAAIGLFSARREKWPLAILAAATLAIAVGIPGISDFVNRLPLFRLALNNRLASATAFLLAALAALGFEELVRSSRRAWILPLGAAALAAIALARRPALVARGVPPAPLLQSAAWFCGGLVLLWILRIALRRPAPFGAAAAALFLVFRTAETPRPSPTFRAADFYPAIPELDRIPRGEPWRIAGLGNALVPNQATLWGLEDARGYEGVNNARLVETFPLWSAAQPVWFNRVDDPNRPFLRFLNVRWLAAAPGVPTTGGRREIARGSALSLFENSAALPRAFAPRRIRFVGDPSRTVREMEANGDFADLAWIEAPGEAPREIDNGAASVRVREHGPDLVLDVDAGSPAWIVASETNWRGWRARENNARYPIRFANHAFVGFRVPAGKHRIRLEYRPASFALGLVAAAAAVAALLLAGFRGRAGAVSATGNSP
ncbi:MAG TPA: YfhO family protein, partial [Thermoanaerobaculia bacterium]|nr:YfhO family protein [Thermoanaerobaculia bacterium]